MTAQVTPVEGLLVRAGVYQLLAVGYAYPRPAQQERVQAVATHLAAVTGPLHPDWPDRLRHLRDQWQAVAAGDLEAEFNRLFSGGMDCTPHETAYERDVFRKQHSLADMAGFYRAFGFELPDGSRWPPDHLGVQLEFCAILLQRAAYALEQGWQDQASVCLDALGKFLLDHPGRWTAAFAADLEQAARTPAYRELGALTARWIEGELGALGLEPDRLRSRQVPPDDLELPVCGACTDCGPVPPAGPCPPPHRPQA